MKGEEGQGEVFGVESGRRDGRRHVMRSKLDYLR